MAGPQGEIEYQIKVGIVANTFGGGRRAPELERNPSKMMKVKSPGDVNQALQLTASLAVKAKLQKEIKKKAKEAKQNWGDPDLNFQQKRSSQVSLR